MLYTNFPYRNYLSFLNNNRPNMKYIISSILIVFPIFTSGFISHEETETTEDSGEIVFSESLSSSTLYKYTDKNGPEFANADSYAGGPGQSEAVSDVVLTPSGTPEAFAQADFKPASFLQNVQQKFKRQVSNEYKNNPNGGQNYKEFDLGNFNIPSYQNVALPPQQH